MSESKRKFLITFCALLAVVSFAAINVLPWLARGQTVTIECAPGSVTSQTLPSGALVVRCAPFKPTPTPTPPPNILPPGIIVAPDGLSTNPGTLAQPLSLAAVTAPNKLTPPGTTVWLRGGTYRGTFDFTASGKSDAPLIFRNYNNERVIFDGAGRSSQEHVVWLNGSDVWLWGIEVTNSAPNRTQGLQSCVYVFGARTKLINCILSNGGLGLGMWTPAIDAEVYGCLIFNNGWQVLPTERGHGHGVYVQGDVGTKRVTDNLIFNQYGYGVHAYTEQGFIKGLHLEGNTIWGSGALSLPVGTDFPNVLIGGYRPAERVTLLNNILYHPFSLIGTYNAQLHFEATPNVDAVLEGNYFAGGSEVLRLQEWQRLTVRNNTIIGAQVPVSVALPEAVPYSSYAWDGNSYVTVGATPALQPFATRQNAKWFGHSFTQWQTSAGWDKSGNWRSVKSAVELGVKVSVRPNRYEAGRAHLTVINWPRQASVSVDLSSVLKSGESFAVFNVAQSLQSPMFAGVFSGAAVSLPTPQELSVFLIKKVQ